MVYILNTMTKYSAKILLEIYTTLYCIRRFEERIAELYTEQEIRCPVHFCIGQEAIATGVSAHLKPQDQVLSGHRAHGHYIAKGGDLAAMAAEFYGKASGCSGGRGGSMHLIDQKAGFLGSVPIVGSTIPIAVGAAFADKMTERDTITIVYFGDAAIETGAFHEAANFAVLHSLPILFICENNLYSVYSPIEVRQPTDRPIHNIAEALGLRTKTSDGNDVLIVYELAGKEIDKIRKGDGPGFIEFSTYRWLEHCGPNFDNHIGYRTEAEFIFWRNQCPVKKFENYLAKLDSIKINEIRAIQDAVKTQVEDAILSAKAAPFPNSGSLSDNLFSEDF